MKIYVNDIHMNEGYVSQKFITVSVIFHDDSENPHKSITATVYVDKEIKDIEEIKNTAIKEAKNFISSITAM